MKNITKWLAAIAILAGAMLIAAESPKMTCTLTGKELPECCCVPQKGGKLLCTLTKQTIEKCCCKGM